MDLSRIGGTGPNGRITASDVERAAGKGPAVAAPAAPAPAAAAAPAPAAAKPAAPSPAAAAAGTTVSELRGVTKPFTTLQMAVSKNMLESLKVMLIHPGWATDAAEQQGDAPTRSHVAAHE